MPSINNCLSVPLVVVLLFCFHVGFAQFICSNASAAVADTEKLFGWGANWHFQLGTQPGNNQVLPSPVMMRVGSATSMNYAKIAGGYMFTVVQEAVAGKAWMAGSGASGQLGLGASAMKDITSFNAIQQVVQDKYPESLYPRFIKDVSAGWWHSCFVARNATNEAVFQVYCMGLNNYGQLGNSWVSTKVSLPVPVTANSSAFRSSSFLAVECGPDYSVALSTEGVMWAWGRGTSGELGNNDKKTSNAPVKVSLVLAVKKVSCGYRFCVALTSSGAIYGWGLNDQRQLGSASTNTTVIRPVMIVSTGASMVAAGGAHVLAVVNSKLYSWGSGTMGQTGIPNDEAVRIKAEWSIATPTVIPALSQVKVRSIAAGHRHSLVLDNCGTVYAFGSDAFGQLGQDKVTPFSKKTRSYVPLVVPAIAKRKLVGVWVAAGPYNSYFGSTA